MGRVLIIGGGASGLLASIFAARAGAGVTLLEHNATLGKKLLATGNGRCNLTNTKVFCGCYRSENIEAVQEILKGFSVEDTLNFFVSLGVATQERNGCLYPRSNQADSVLEALRMEAEYRKVKIKTNAHVTDISKTKIGWEVYTADWTYAGDAVILATGSQASQIPGSDGSGYKIVRKLGLSLVEPWPALVPLICRGADFSKWAGVRIDGKVTLYQNGRKLIENTGELQLTNYGVSGIPIFQISRWAAKAIKEGQKVTLTLDFLPELDKEAVKSLLQKRQEDCPYKSPSEQLVGLFPRKLISVLLSGPSLIKSIKEFPLQVQRPLSFAHAQVCAGGVALKEVNPATMEACRFPGLYLTGELLDVDGACGGYNLQWAWTTGALAGKSAGKECR